MVASLNKVTLIGNVGKVPEIRTTQDGKEIASFSIATSEAWKDKMTGERREKTEWHRVVVFSQPLINIIKKYVNKGTKVYVEGALHTRKWNDQSGVEKYTTEIVLQNYNGVMMMLDKTSGQSDGHHEGGGYSHATENENAPQYNPSTSHDFGDKAVEDLDDEIPF